MNQISEALRASIAKDEAAFSQRVTVALLHFPRIISDKNSGNISGLSRQAVIDHLIRDGILGPRGNGRYIAHAKKHDTPLDTYKAQLANKIVNSVLNSAEKDGHIVLTITSKTFEIRLIRPYFTSAQAAIKQEDRDVDESYTLRDHLPRHRAQRWGIHLAHE